MVNINSELCLHNGWTLKNRLVKGQTEGLADLNNHVSKELINFYSEYATRSDCGLIITGNVLVDRRFLRRPRNVVIDPNYQENSDEQMEQLSKLAAAAKQNNTKVLCQLNHVGRFALADVSKVCLAPSAVTKQGKLKKYAKAREMTVEEIADVVDRFGFAAKRCEDAGFDGIQLHYAYGFLLVSFLKLHVNRRTDEYGGSLENRLRILYETIRRVKQEVSEGFLVSIKMSTQDLIAGGLSTGDAVEVICSLADMGIGLFEINGGHYEKTTAILKGASGTHSHEEKYFLKLVRKLRTEFKKKKIKANLIITGNFRTLKGMNRVFEYDDADLIGIGRPLCVDVECTKKLLDGKIQRLPDPGTSWNLPQDSKWWTCCRNNKSDQEFREAYVELTLCQNLIDIGFKKFQAQTDTKHPNILLTARQRLKIEEEEAKSIKL